MKLIVVAKVGLAGGLVAALLATLATTFLPSSQLRAQNTTGGHAGHNVAAAPTPKAVADLPSVKAYMAVNDKMHKDMAVAFSGNADADFVRGMIPHHQGAVDMAKIVLEHGKDPAIRRLAGGIIRSQNAEIAMMKAWLKKHDAKSHKH